MLTSCLLRKWCLSAFHIRHGPLWGEKMLKTTTTNISTYFRLKASSECELVPPSDRCCLGSSLASPKRKIAWRVKLMSATRGTTQFAGTLKDFQPLKITIFNKYRLVLLMMSKKLIWNLQSFKDIVLFNFWCSSTVGTSFKYRSKLCFSRLVKKAKNKNKSNMPTVTTSHWRWLGLNLCNLTFFSKVSH